MVIGRGDKRIGLFEKCLGAVRFEFHEFEEAVVVGAIFEVFLSEFELREIFERKIDAAVRDIFADIAQDIGELQRLAESEGVVFGFFRLASKQADGNEAHGAGDFPDVVAEVIPCLKPLRFKIHQAAIDHRREEFGGNLMSVPQIGDFALQFSGFLKPIVQPLLPLFEGGAALLFRDAFVIRKVVHGAAVGVEHHRVVALFLGQDFESEREVRLGATGDLGSFRHLSYLMKPQ